MKKLIYFTLLILSFAVYSCSSDDDDPEPEKFVWGGDWNNPDDPNYKAEYGGKYNPVKGLWKYEKEDIKTHGLLFDDDFNAYYAHFNNYGKYTGKDFAMPYIINDKAYKLSTGIWRYKVEDNKLYIYPNFNDDDDVRSLTRIQQ